MGKHLPKQCVLLVCCLVAISTASEDAVDQFDQHNQYSVPLHMLAKHGIRGQQKAEGTTNPGTAPTTAAAPPPNIVTSLTEAITLAVVSGICGPSLIALIGCGIRQMRLTRDDPFGGGERPVDEAAERRKRKKQLQQQGEGEGESANNNTPATKVVTNNLDPMNLDKAMSLDLDKIRTQFPTAKYSNTEKNLAGKLNKGYSKTAEDIL